MSHVVKTTMVYKDLESLEAAVAECGCVLDKGKYEQTEIVQSWEAKKAAGKLIKWNWVGRWFNDYKQEDAAFKHGVSPEQYGLSDMVIRVPGHEGKCAEIGVYEMDYHIHPKTGEKIMERNYALVLDYFTSGIKTLTDLVGGPSSEADYIAGNSRGDGKNVNRLANAYAEKVALKQLPKGCRVLKEILPDGRVTLRATGLSLRR